MRGSLKTRSPKPLSNKTTKPLVYKTAGATAVSFSPGCMVTCIFAPNILSSRVRTHPVSGGLPLFHFQSSMSAWGCSHLTPCQEEAT